MDAPKRGLKLASANTAEVSVYSVSMDSDSSEATSVLQLRISLRGVSPPVWRRLLIPEQITIGRCQVDRRQRVPFRLIKVFFLAYP
jgi:hypothetical protein